MRNHTPGPWKVLQEKSGLKPWLIYESTGEFLVCDLRHAEINAARDEANAHLIAAAPDLLDALKKLHRFMHDHVGFSDCPTIDEQACIAIKKAEGETP